MIWLVSGLLGVAVLQTTLTPLVEAGGVRPDLFLLLLYLGSYKWSPERACLGGCLLGLYQDALSGAPLGLKAFTLSLLGFLLVRVRLELEESRLTPHLFLLFLTGLSSGLITLGTLAFFGMGRDLGETFIWIVLPETAYTTVVGGLLLFATRASRFLEVRL
ncbi:MAG: rod shape-determining protein MreD [Candidatus Methylomirabilales bacterium]